MPPLSHFAKGSRHSEQRPDRAAFHYREGFKTSDVLEIRSLHGLGGTSSGTGVSKLDMISLVTTSIVLVLLQGLGQSQGRLQFEVATLKLEAPVPPGTPIGVTLGNMTRSGTVTFRNVTLSECIQFAYGIASDAQIAGPDWIRSRDVRFEIVGKAPMPETPIEQFRLMMQSLLAERLSLEFHNEKKELPFLALVVSKNGTKLKPAVPADSGSPVPIPAQIPGRVLHPRMPIAVLANLLSRFERQNVIDMTGLTLSDA